MFVIGERNRQNFEVKLASKAWKTRELYKTVLNNFESFCLEQFGKPDIIDEIKSQDPSYVYDVLQAWINQNTEINPNSVQIYFSFLKKYLNYRGIHLYSEDVKQNLDFPHEIEEELYGLQLNDIRKIIDNALPTREALYLCQISSLMRIGELLQIRKQDLDLNYERIIVRIPAKITKLKRSRTTFFSFEAEQHLKPFLNELKDEDFIFNPRNNLKSAQAVEAQSLRNNLKRLRLYKTYRSNGVSIITTHSFRAYGITKLSRFDPNFAKMLAGQKGYLLQYDRMNFKETLERYLELENELLIYDTSKAEKRNDELDNRITELESYIKRRLEKSPNFVKVSTHNNF